MKYPWLIAALVAASLGAKAPAASQGQRYRLIDHQDVASWLVLHPDGRFEYMLAAGALDEEAHGRWTREGKTIRLTTQPKPKPALFIAGTATRTSQASLAIKVTWPNGSGIAGVDFELSFKDGGKVQGYTQEDGWTLDPVETRKPVAIELAVPMHGLRSAPFPIDVSKANQLTFVLEPNDLGVIDFENIALTVDGDRLVMHRDGSNLTYIAQK